MCHGIQAEVRGQLVAIGSLPSAMWVPEIDSGHSSGYSKCLYPLSISRACSVYLSVWFCLMAQVKYLLLNLIVWFLNV